MEKHVHVLGILHIVYNALGLLIGIFIFWVLMGAGIISKDSEAITILFIVATSLASFFIIMSVPGILGGIFLIKWKNWARIVVLILGFLSLLEIPFGTALGIYTIWVLLNDETIELFEKKKRELRVVAEAQS